MRRTNPGKYSNRENIYPYTGHTLAEPKKSVIILTTDFFIFPFQRGSKILLGVGKFKDTLHPEGNVIVFG